MEEAKEAGIQQSQIVNLLFSAFVDRGIFLLGFDIYNPLCHNSSLISTISQPVARLLNLVWR